MQVSEASVLIIVDRSQLDAALSDAGVPVGGGASSSGGSSISAPSTAGGSASRAGTVTDDSSTPTLQRFRSLTPGATFLTDAMTRSVRNSMARNGANEALMNRAQGAGERISDFGLNVFSRTPAGRSGLRTLEGMKGAAKEAGRGMSGGWAEGLRNSLSGIDRESRSVADGLVRASREEGEIASPSGKARRELGRQWSAGVAQGINEGKGKLSSAIQRNTDDALRVGVKGRAQRDSGRRSAAISPRALMASHMGLVARSANLRGIANAGFAQWGKRTANKGQTVRAQIMPQQQRSQRRAPRARRVNRGAVMSQIGMPARRAASSSTSGVKNNFRNVGGGSVADEVAMNIQRSLRRLGVM